MRLLARSLQGERDADRRELDSMLEASQSGSHHVDVAFGLLIAALISARSCPTDALKFLERMLPSTAQDAGAWGAALFPEAARLAVRGSEPALTERLLRCLEGPLPSAALARESIGSLLAEARGDHETAAAGFADAAVRWHEFGVPYEEGHALFGQGRCLAALRRAHEAAARHRGGSRNLRRARGEAGARGARQSPQRDQGDTPLGFW